MAKPITLHANMDRLEASVAELSELLKGRDRLEFDGEGLSVELREFLVDGFRPGFDGSKLFRVESHVSALDAYDVLVSFEPSDLLLELLAALRAGDGNNG